jgi:integrase
LENEALVKHPRAVLKSAIATWNQCRKRVPGWPQTALFSPFKQKPYMIEMAAFPEGFRRDVALWEARMRNPDPLDLDAPLRALRPDTLDGYRFCFRRLASALVHEGHVPLAAVTGLAVLVEGDNLKRALRPFLAREGRSTAYAWRMAAQMHAIARHFLRLPQERIDAIGTLVARLKHKGGGAMGERNRRRLAQFDDEVTVRRLLGLPREELARALRLKNPLRRAKAVERALAISLSIFASLRARNLRSLRLDRNFRRSGKRLFLEFTADEMKSGAELTLELPQETIGLLDRFVADHRSLLAGAGGPYLFPGENGGPRSYSAIRDAVGVYVRKRTGLDISPHLYRHATAKIVIERQPELAFDLSRRLGHRNVNTTYQAYLGTETPAASRRINELLKGVCANRRDPGTAKPRAKPPRKPAAGRRS